ncbi:Uncharacterised protein [Edwardsiella hoshinae]|uniref:Uncharacterized protein n=1 Tax=Edwardsiella hoshinae TaxID=93378 RepID=A0A376DAC1_9GAMM|nr:Uncharacterised protein [Edwardsiella hoshinae]
MNGSSIRLADYDVFANVFVAICYFKRSANVISWIANFCCPGSIIEGRDNGGIKEKVLVFIHVITSALAIFIDTLETRADRNLEVVVGGFLIAIFGFDFFVIIFSHKTPLIINRISQLQGVT